MGVLPWSAARYKIARMQERRLYLVCGLPGAGKTTRSRQIVDSVGGLYLSADEWVLGLGMSLLDFDFRVRLQDCLLRQAGELLRCGVSVILEFGSWTRSEREAIRQVGERAGALVELHFVDAPLDELVQRVRARGGLGAEELASKVLLQESGRFEHPSPDEIALFQRYFGPDDEWLPEVRER